MSVLVRDKSFYKKILTIGGPIAAQQVITVGVNMMDNIMLGRLTEVAIDASALAVQVHNLFTFMCMGLSMGASVLIARFWGAGERVSLRKTLTLMYRSCLILSALFTLVVGFAPYQVMSLLTPDPEVIAAGASYLRWALPCFFLYGLSLTTTNVLRNVGLMRIPLYTSIGAFFINIFFNWMLIFGKLGAPAMGVAGAALGTLISRAFEFIIICGYLLFREKTIRFQIREILTPCRDLLPEYIRVCIPVFISDTLLGVGNSLTVTVASHVRSVSGSFMSAYAITTVTQQVATVFSAGLGQSALIIIGNTLGEGEPDRAQQEGGTFTILGLVMGVLAGGLIVAISPLIVGYYNITADTATIAMELMRSVGVVTIFTLSGSILTKGVLRGGGDTRFLMIADILFLWCVSVPLGYFAGIVWGWPPFWIFFSLRIDHAIKVAWCMFRLRSGKWMKKISSVD